MGASLVFILTAMLLDSPFHPHPDLVDDASYRVVTVDALRALGSYRQSLLAHEWLTADGTVKSMDALAPEARAARTRIESLFHTRQSLPYPVIGWGMFDCFEIGAGRDVFLTLAALGMRHIPVHAPVSMIDFLKSFIVDPGQKSKSSERGNVLVYLLICVALLGALTYTVANSTRSSSAMNLTDSQASTLATEILTVANHTETAVSKLTLRGCTDTQISFENNTVTGYVNASAPSDLSCHVFEPAGGTLTFVTPPAEMNNGTPWFYTGAAVAHNGNGFQSSNSAEDADLVMMLFGLPQNVCSKINKQLGITGVPVNDGSYGDATKFQGSYSYAEDINGLPETAQPSPCSSPSTAQNFCGKSAGCFREEGGAERYVFFQVLIQR